MIICLKQLTTCTIYIDILQQDVLPHAKLAANNFKLQDNTRPHRAAIVQIFLENDITKLEWPARSPDMNSIKHLWDELDRTVRSRLRPLNNLTEMTDTLLKEWNSIPVVTIGNLFFSMPRILEVFRVAREGKTLY